MGIDLGKLFDPGALAHAAADAILPKDMEWMGGILGAAVDLQCGNPLGALKEGLDTLADLKDVSQTQKGPSKSLNAPGGWSYEPSPPPRSVPAPTAWTKESNLRATPPAGSSTTVTTIATATTTVTTAGSSKGQDVVAKAEASATAFFQASGTAPAATPAPPPSAWRGTPPPPAQRHNWAAAVLDVLGGQGRVVGTKDPSTMSKAEFMAQGNEAFMKAVRDGKIPQEISDSPAAMQALQARMNQISEMNQLMTSMIQAMHQMQMAVIQNVRV